MKPRSPEICPRCGHRLEGRGSFWPIQEPRGGGALSAEIPQRSVERPPGSGIRAADGQAPEPAPETFDALIETMRRREKGATEKNGEGDREEAKSWRSLAGGED